MPVSIQPSSDLTLRPFIQLVSDNRFLLIHLVTYHRSHVHRNVLYGSLFANIRMRERRCGNRSFSHLHRQIQILMKFDNSTFFISIIWHSKNIDLTSIFSRLFFFYFLAHSKTFHSVILIIWILIKFSSLIEKKYFYWQQDYKSKIYCSCVYKILKNIRLIV